MTLAVLFSAAIVGLLAVVYIGFWRWEARQSGAWTQWVHMFFPRSECGSLGLEVRFNVKMKILQ